MREDIEIKPVEGVAVAITKEKDHTVEDKWTVYLLNENNVQIENVIVSSKGYGQKDGQKQETSILRHVFEKVEPNHFVQVELIDPSVFHLTNQYWVSYYIDGHIYDKKFIFVPEAITDQHITHIPLLELEGILHR